MKHYNPNDFGFTVGRTMGDEAMVICPFHDDTKPSAVFNVSTGLFFCYACRTGLNVNQLAKRLKVNGIAKREVTHTGRLDADEDLWERRWSAATQVDDSSYILSRGVSLNLSRQLMVREDREGILFPQSPDGVQVVGIQVRSTTGRGPRYKFHGKRLPLWPFWLWKEAESPVLTEGSFGALRLRGQGLSAFATQSANVPKRSVLAIAAKDSGTIFFDADEAGQRAAVNLAVQTGMRVCWPGGATDEMTPEAISFALMRSMSVSQLLKVVYEL